MLKELLDNQLRDTIFATASCAALGPLKEERAPFLVRIGDLQMFNCSTAKLEWRQRHGLRRYCRKSSAE